MTDLSKQTPVQIDTEIARINGLIGEQTGIIGDARRVIEIAKKRIEQDAWDAERQPAKIEAAEAKIAAAKAALVPLHDEIAPYRDEYEVRGWTRYYLVTNVNGHIHSSMHCSTCFPTTEFGWLPQCSGRTPEDMIKEHGEDMCSECFPSAPAIAKGFRKSEADKQAARQEREAKREAKRAEQIEVIKANGRTETFKTRRAVENEIARCIYNAVTWEGGSKLDEDRAEALAEALAKKVGENPAEILATSKAKQLKKRISELRRSVKRFKAGDWGMLGQASFTDEDRAKALAKAEASLAHFEALAA